MLTLDELADKANAALGEADNKRLEAGRYLLEARERLGKGFRKWALMHIVNRSITDVYRCMEEAENDGKEVVTSCDDTIPTPEPEPHRDYTPGGTLAQDFIASFNQLPPDEQEVCRLLVLGHLRKDIKRAKTTQAPAHGDGSDGNVVALFR